MFRYNMLVGLVCAMCSVALVAGEEDWWTDFSYDQKDGTLTLPNGQSVKSVAGVQKCDKTVFIVSKELGAYDLRRKKYTVLPVPVPGAATSTFVLIPFEREESYDPRADKKFAFVAIKDGTATTGVFRYEEKLPHLHYMTISGGIRLEGVQLWVWHTFMTDIVGQPDKEKIMIDTTGGYCYSARLVGQGMVGITPKPESPEGKRLAAIKERYAVLQAQRAAAESFVKNPM